MMITCRICNRTLTALTASHLKLHGVSMAEYRRQYPDAAIRTMSPLARQRISEQRRGMEFSDEHRLSISLSLYGNKRNQGRVQAEETKLKISNSKKGKAPRWKDPVERAKRISDALTGMVLSPERCKRQKGIALELWQNPKYVTKQMKARNVRPNKAELTLDSLLNLHFPEQWRYVGDGEVIIGGKCPDFININGKKQVIELFGIYWHSVLDIAKRTEHFRQYGFSTLVIWEDELANPDKVIKKIKTYRKS